MKAIMTGPMTHKKIPMSDSRPPSTMRRMATIFICRCIRPASYLAPRRPGLDLAVAPITARNGGDDRDEERGAHDRPDHGKRLVSDADREDVRKAKLVREPRPEERADEANGDRPEASHVAVTNDALTDRAAHTGD